MKIVKRVLVVLLAVYLVLSIAASIIVQTCTDYTITRAIVNNRYGLLIGNYDSQFDTFALLSPFCNYPDIFLLVVDFTDGIEFRSDGLDYFGHW